MNPIASTRKIFFAAAVFAIAASIAKRRVPPGCAILSVRGSSRIITRTRPPMPKRAKENEKATAAAALQLERTQPRSDMSDLKKPTIAEIFGPGGAIEKYMPE